MDPGLANDIAAPYLTNGVLGASVVVLALVILKLWGEMKSERAAHKVEIAAKDALINELQQQRLDEALSGRDVNKSVQASLDAFLLAIRSGGGKA